MIYFRISGLPRWMVRGSIIASRTKFAKSRKHKNMREYSSNVAMVKLFWTLRDAYKISAASVMIRMWYTSVSILLWATLFIKYIGNVVRSDVILAFVLAFLLFKRFFISILLLLAAVKSGTLSCAMLFEAPESKLFLRLSLAELMLSCLLFSSNKIFTLVKKMQTVQRTCAKKGIQHVINSNRVLSPREVLKS